MSDKTDKSKLIIFLALLFITIAVALIIEQFISWGYYLGMGSGTSSRELCFDVNFNWFYTTNNSFYF